ncbi:hypothetical protein KP509_1Z028800 [Ceratopteris richardii]|nr:hypothetical protein KP509_1Z028800 [Ceratopteris richardii]
MSRASVVTVDHPKSFCKKDSLIQRVQSARLLLQTRSLLNEENVCSLIHACTFHKDLSAAKYLHSIFIELGIHTVSFVGDHIIRMYESCKNLQSALRAFHQVSYPSLYTWNAIISAHSSHDEHAIAFNLFNSMLQQRIYPDKFTFLCALKASKKFFDHSLCRLLHDLILKMNFEDNQMVMNTIIDIYAKCGALDDASKVFFRMDVKNVVSWGVLIAGYITHGYELYALELFSEMQQSGDEPHSRLFASLLKACSKMDTIMQGLWVHDKIIKRGSDNDVMIGSSLVDMYAKYGDAQMARLLFDRLKHRDVASWTALISGYTTANMHVDALEAFAEMQREGLKPDGYIFSSVLKASTCIKAVCYALKASDLLGERNVFTWGALIACAIESGDEPLALMLFGGLCKEGVIPDAAVFSCVLHACGILSITEVGHLVHSQIVHEGIQLSEIIAKDLLKMYIACGNIDDAQGTVNLYLSKDEEAWSLLLREYCHFSGFSTALDTFFKKLQDGVRISDKLVCLSVLKSCGRVKDVNKGFGIHDQMIKNGWELDVFAGSTLVDMYGSCGRVEEARKVFKTIMAPDLVAWGAIMAVYEQNSDPRAVLQLYEDMQLSGQKPDKAMLVCVLKACGLARVVKLGFIIHDLVIKIGVDSDSVIENIILDMYSNFEFLGEAERIFLRQHSHDAVSLSTIMEAFMRQGQYLTSLKLFEKMQSELLQIDAVLLSSVLYACSLVGLLKSGMLVHDQIVKNGWESKEFVLLALLRMYGKCGALDEVHRIFNNIENPNKDLWNELISAFVIQGHGEHSLLIHKHMKEAFVIPNEASIMWLLQACSDKAHIDQGMSLHGEIIKFGLEGILPLSNSIANMYARLGGMEASAQTLARMPARDHVTWSVMISAALANHSRDVRQVRDWIGDVQFEGLHADSAIYTCLLQACSQAGLVNDGIFCFGSSITDRSIEHYSCMVDLFGRCGCLDLAEDLMQTMPIQNEVLTWTAFLNSHRIYSNIQINEPCIDSVYNKKFCKETGFDFNEQIFNTTLNFQKAAIASS